MNPSLFLWAVTVVVLLAVLVLDPVLLPGGEHAPPARASAALVVLYALMSVLFGLAVLASAGPVPAGRFFSGWLAAFTLSLDKVFVFLLITTGLGLSRRHRDAVVVVGMFATLVLCGAFTALGTASISRFDLSLCALGALLLYAGFDLFRRGEREEPPPRSPSGGLAASGEGHLGALRAAGAAALRPATLLLIAVGAVVVTDLLFAMSSVSAASGLTGRSYLVFSANAFALLGLRQLFLLIHGFLDRMIHAGIGFAVLLALIGVKLVLDAVHPRELARVPELILFSFGMVVLVLAVTAVASRLTPNGHHSESHPGSPEGAVAREGQSSTAPGSDAGVLADTAVEARRRAAR